MRSLRLDDELDAQVRRAAEVSGESVSEFIRRAAADRAASTLSDVAQSNSALVKEIIGDVPGAGGGQAHRTGEAFGDLLESDHARQVSSRRRTG